MANEKKAAKPATEGDKPKRVVKRLTDAERVTKLEADLAAAKAKAEEKAGKEVDKLREQRDAVAKRRDALTTKVEELDAKINELSPVDDEAEAEGYGEPADQDIES